MMTTYYERHGTLYKLEVGDNVLDYGYVNHRWSQVYDALTRWIMDGDSELQSITAPDAEAKYPGSTGGTA